MMELIKSITGQEWKFWAKVLVAVLVLTSLSRIFIVIMTPGDSVPRGNNIFSFIDRHVYTSYIEQAREGRYFFDDLFTAKEDSVPMLNLFWLGAGLFARFTHLSANATLEFLRVLFIPFLLLAVYLLVAYFIKDIRQRRQAFLLASLGGGLGTVFLPAFYIMELMSAPGVMTRNFPIDLDKAESFIFSTSYYSAHFVFSTILFVLILLLSLLAIDKKKLFYSLPAGLLSLVLINFHPFTFISVFFILFSYFIFLLWKSKNDALFFIKYGFIAGAIALPSVFYHISMFYTPWWQNQTWNSGTVTPFFLAIIAGYGVMLYFIFRSLQLSFGKKIEIHKENFLLVWLLSQFVLVFMPVSVQGRFLEGYWLVLVIAGSYSLTLFLKKKDWIIKSKIYAAGLFIAVFSLSFILLIVLDLKNILLRGNLIYIKKDAVAAMRGLKNIAGRDDLVLADIYNSSVIPGIAVRRVFVGHGVETIDYDRKYKILKQFMASGDEKERELILRNNKIAYLFYDGSWKKDWAWNPDDEKFLQKIYERGNYKIYTVK